MVRLAALLVLSLAGAAAAQDTPPVVASDPPVLAEPETGSEAMPALPSPAVADLPEHSGAPMPAVDTNLAALVLKAHPVVQAVMALLVASVFAVLTIFLFKAVEFTLAFTRLSREARALSASPALEAVPGSGPLAQTLQAARAEAAALPATLTADLRLAARERLDLSLSRIEANAVRQLRSATGLLATIGSVAPFVGLFGTVFGIMNSFLAIAATQTTNLAIVAPGIAEALLATGIGLAAAIPAVMLYNRALRRIAEFRHRLADGTAEILRRFSRACDQRMGQGG
ncbi:MAG: MotA/TolQ/ExbB proton channel family protein [Tabrizicola sp.]|nr:MotA/TolQ/ExbB proton channel family protein [Tabrizicola sp.]